MEFHSNQVSPSETPIVSAIAPLQAIALRLTPGQDLKAELETLVQTQAWSAACILTCVGSLTKAHLRLANQAEGTHFAGPFEIVSLTGVMSVAGSHYHVAIANTQGHTLGGHLLPGCTIHTTAEIIIGILPTLHFDRQPCPQSGYHELAVEPTSFSQPS